MTEPHRSLEADVLRTSGCGDAASKRPPPRSLLEPLAADSVWADAVERFAERAPRRTDRAGEYRRLLEEGRHRAIAEAVLAGSYRPEPPEESQVNKAGGRRKRVFRQAAPDELLFRVVNRLLQPSAADHAGPWCRSFLPGGGARTAFSSLLRDPDLGVKAAVRLDVRDYFNSIDPADLIARMPWPDDEPLRALLRATLLDRRVVRHGQVVDGGRKGVMAGTPLAPVLATLYLRHLDAEVAGAGLTYARYSDDVIALGSAAEVDDAERRLRRGLAAVGLQVNESKTMRVAPGGPWDFLGFRYCAGTIGLAPHTAHKLQAKSTRLARRLVRWRERSGAAPERALGAYVRRTNRNLYGAASASEFSWATWFFPLLSTDCDLHRLDAHLLREARYAATGRRTGRAAAAVPYAAVAEAGLLPLVGAFWAHRQGRPRYEALVTRRTGLAPR